MSINWSLSGFTKSKGSKFTNIKNFAIASYLEECVSSLLLISQGNYFLTFVEVSVAQFNVLITEGNTWLASLPFSVYIIGFPEGRRNVNMTLGNSDFTTRKWLV